MLQMELENLEELEESLKELYEEQEDGKFKLRVEGVEDVTGLKSALEKERNAHREMKAKLEGFKDVDLEEYQRLLKMQEDQQKKIPKIESMQVTIEEQQKQIDQYRKEMDQALIEREIRNAAGRGGIQDSAIEDVLNRGFRQFSVQEGRIVSTDGTGKVRFGDDGYTPYGADDLMTELRESAPHLFRRSSGSGAEGSGSEVGDLGIIKTEGDPRVFGEHLEDIAKGRKRVVA